jgi:hypothetical protein
VFNEVDRAQFEAMIEPLYASIESPEVAAIVKSIRAE